LQPDQHLFVDVPLLDMAGTEGNAQLCTKPTLTLLTLFALAMPVAAKEQVQSDNHVLLIKASPGCANREEFEAMIDLAQRRDAAGFANYVASHHCPVLQPGTAAVYDDLAYSGRAMCVRRPGDTNCFWIPSAAVQKPGRSIPAIVF
jgi:hypothetical protein